MYKVLLSERDQEYLADLKVQAMLFDLVIDWDTLELVPKQVDETPAWAQRYRDSRGEADFDERIDVDR